MKRRLGMTAAALTASALLAGCASQGEEAASATDDTVAAQTHAAETGSEARGTDSFGDMMNASDDRTSLTVDGKDVPLDNTEVTCDETNGTTTIRVVDNARPDEGVGVLLNEGELSTFSASLNGVTLTVFPGNTGEASLKVDDKTYEISGTAEAVEETNLEAGTKPLDFSFSVTCP